ncbi:hypothetical protein [Mesorhizobium sp. NZP2077]|uniref:hypothetical protein n=1 Tax=Mesorhizobium sp. NZP2077 TaxID=2483404 RepID=UPI001557521D|nr:hypothetical protein [Mesorhizobium sp. NZP2077]QKD17408.1 hypothetical protein HGP13_21480 [Mesorhizobium sp. NZP2077]
MPEFRQAERVVLVRRLGSRRDRTLGLSPAEVDDEKKPKDWQPLPEVYQKAREEEQAAALERFRAKQAEHRARLIKLSDGRPTPALAE